MKIDCYTYLRALVVILSLTAACHSDELSSPSRSSNTASESEGFIARWSGFEFTHPGILSSAADLTYIRNAIARGIEPQASQFGYLTSTPSYYTPHPVQHPCAGFSGASSEGCDAQTWFNQLADANTAYSYALIAALKGNSAYAKAAENILDAWVTGGPPGRPNPSRAYKGNVGPSWYLCTAWISYQWAEVAEILRATDPHWAGAKPFGELLNNYVLPVLHHRHAFGNRGWAVINGLMAVGVYNDDPAAFAEGLTDFNNLIRSYYFVEGDSADKKPLPMDYYLYWPTDAELLAVDRATTENHWKTANGWTSYVELAKDVVNLGDDTRMLELASAEPAYLWTLDAANCGLAQFLSGYTAETCRDLGHTQMAMSLTFNSAQIAWNQGIDLYTPNADRLTVAMELVESWILGVSPAPLTVTGNGAGSFEMAYNHFANIMGMRLPFTEKLVGINRSASEAGAVGYRHGTNCDTLAGLTSGSNEFCSFQQTTYNFPTATSATVDDPKVSISSNYPVTKNGTGEIPISVIFDRPVTGFSLSGVRVNNGTAAHLTRTGSVYTIDILPVVDPADAVRLGHVITTVSINPGAAASLAGYPNSSSTQLEFFKLFSRDLAAQNSGYTGLWTVLMFGDLNKANPSYP